MQFSVIIPNYNRTIKLQRAIKSVLEQTFQNFEIIIIDDASTIEITPFIASFEDDRISLIRLSENGGVANARNTGASYAKGNYIAFLDSDDEWFPDYLEHRNKVFTKENCDGIYGAVIKYYDNKLEDKPPVRLPQKNETMVSYLLSGTMRASTSTLILNRKAFIQILFDTSLKVHEDHDMIIRFSEEFIWYCDTEPRTTVYISSSGLSSVYPHKVLIKFLKKNLNDIRYRLLFFYVMRKCKTALERKERNFIPEYLDLLKVYAGNRTKLETINQNILSVIPVIYIKVFNFLITKMMYLEKKRRTLFS